MVSVNVTLSTHKMMSPDFKSVNNCCQFQVMGWIVLLMIPERSGCIGNDRSFCIRTQPRPVPEASL
jgi:hypothetical protein